MPQDRADRSQTQTAAASGLAQQLNEICDRFELSWQELRPPRINSVISEVAADLQQPLLMKLVPLDIEGRWRYARTAETVDRSGDDSQPNDALPLRPRLEDYVWCFSTLLQFDELPADLVTHEYRVRHRWGDRPDHSEYASRFASGGDEQFRQEARFKSALCLAALNRDDDANTIFESLLGENGDRWPPLAGCQLWVSRLRQHRDVEAEAIFEILSGRFSVEQLAALTPADVREEILRSYSSEFKTLDKVLRFTPKRIEHAERALAIDQFLNPNGGDAALPLHLMRAYEARGDFDRALELAVPYARRNPRFSYVQRRWVRLLCLAGRPREALEVVDRILSQTPAELAGFRQVMLLERSRAYSAAGDFENAESDIDALLAEPLAEDLEKEYLVSYAYLLQGALRDRRGDAAGARKAWQDGLDRLRQLGESSGLSPTGVALRADPRFAYGRIDRRRHGTLRRRRTGRSRSVAFGADGTAAYWCSHLHGRLSANVAHTTGARLGRRFRLRSPGRQPTLSTPPGVGRGRHDTRRTARRRLVAGAGRAGQPYGA